MEGKVLRWCVGVLDMKWWREGMVAWFVAAGEVDFFVVESVASVCFCGCGGDEIFEGFFHCFGNDGAKRGVGGGGQYALGR